MDLHCLIFFLQLRMFTELTERDTEDGAYQ